jgi:hypothetical protein
MNGYWEGKAAMEYRLSGPPRMGGRFTASMISSTIKGLARLVAGKRRRSPVFTIFVIARSDGAVAIERGDAAASALSETYWTPVIFHFREPGAAEAVMSGARRRLTNERRDESGFWYLGMSSGQVAAAIKTEAKGLYSFEVIHPHLSEAPIVGADGRSWARRAAGVAPLAIVLSAGEWSA